MHYIYKWKEEKQTMDYENSQFVYDEFKKHMRSLIQKVRDGHIVTDKELLDIEEMGNDIYSHRERTN
jgi:hypothetical protein